MHIFLHDDYVFFILHPRNSQPNYTLPDSVIQCKVNREIELGGRKMTKTQGVKYVDQRRLSAWWQESQAFAKNQTDDAWRSDHGRISQLLNDALQLRQQAVDVGIAADGDAQAVAVTFIGHVADQDFSLPKLFENMLCTFGRMATPKEVGLAR